MQPLRDWQQRNNERFVQKQYPPRWLLCAVPGSGKTIAAASMARMLKDAGLIDRVVILTPSVNIRGSWKWAMRRYGFEICTNVSELTYDQYDGIALCFQLLGGSRQSAASAVLEGFASRHRVLYIVDEVHHAGESGPNGKGNTWGDGLLRLLDTDDGHYMIGLSGTPWREQGRGHLPQVDYQPVGDGSWEAKPSFSYSYGEAIRDGVCRPVECNFLDARGRDVTPDGVTPVELNADTPDSEARRIYRAALSQVDSPLVKRLIQRGQEDLVRKRFQMPAAAALYVADDIAGANRAAAEIERLTGAMPVVVHSSNPSAESDLRSFAGGDSPWLVAVDMVTEGVDIPRIAVVVYATTDATELKFRQIVGRALRSMGSEDELIAAVYLAALPTLIAHAEAIEEENRTFVVGLLEESLDAVRGLRELISSIRTESLEITDSSDAGTVFAGAWDTEKGRRLYDFFASQGIPEKKARSLVPGALLVLEAAPSVPQAAETLAMPKEDEKKALKTQIKKHIGQLMALRGTRADEDFKAFNVELIRQFGGSRETLGLDALRDQLRYIVDTLKRERR